MSRDFNARTPFMNGEPVFDEAREEELQIEYEFLTRDRVNYDYLSNIKEHNGIEVSQFWWKLNCEIFESANT